MPHFVPPHTRQAQQIIEADYRIVNIEREPVRQSLSDAFFTADAQIRESNPIYWFAGWLAFYSALANIAYRWLT